ncbi:ribosomal protein L10-domain-containing protein [Baffinella frigidus]|nr:ribosomal protein L10-domain-containing protein [Cryptophyta sp. CCMP2293]
MGKEEVARVYNDRKISYAARLEKLLANNAKVLVMSADNVGSQQMHVVRAELRKSPKAEIIMGKNTMIKYVIRKYAIETGDAAFNKLADACRLNVGLVFTNDDMKKVKETLEKNKVTAAAKAGSLAQVDVILDPGVTSLEPTQTGFFQALGVATKITKGTIEVISKVQLATAGEKIGPSQAVLMSKMGMKPFQYGLVVIAIFDGEGMLAPEVLEIDDAAIHSVFQTITQRVASLCLAIGYPATCAVPHMLLDAFKNCLKVAIATEISFDQADKIKDAIANPEKYAGSGGGAAPAAKAAAPAAKAAAPEPEEEEDMGFSLFD